MTHRLILNSNARVLHFEIECAGGKPGARQAGTYMSSRILYSRGSLGFGLVLLGSGL